MENDLRRVAEEIARRIRKDTGTDGPHVVDLPRYYFQYLTDPEEPGIHLELPSNGMLPDRLHISAAQEQILRDLGFSDPDEDWPNWYLQTIDESEADSVGWAVVDALVTAYQVPIEDVAEAVGLPRLAYSGDPRKSFRVETNESGLVAHPQELGQQYEAYLAARRPRPRYRSPWQPGTRATFFAEVMPDDTSAVIDLFALTNAGPGDNRATWLRRERLGWVVDPLMAVRLARGKTYGMRRISRKLAAQVEPTMTFHGEPVVMPGAGSEPPHT
jgi:hypothetical protein